jgi:spore maturation protein CgeB
VKILITNSKNTNLLAPQFYEGAKSIGENIEGTYYVDDFNNYLKKSLLNRLMFRMNSKIIYDKLNKSLLKDVQRFNPDVLWIFKGMEIYPETLKTIKDKGVQLVNYNLDHPFNYISGGSGNSNVLNSIELFDLHFSYSEQIIKELKNKFVNIKTKHLPFGYPDNVPFEAINNVEEVNEACFVGYADKKRAEFINSIASKKIKINVYGPKWEKFISKSNKYIKIQPPAYGLDYWKTLRTYRVQLNLLRDHNYLSHNMRTFEIPCVGGIMLTQDTPEHLSHFKADEEAFFFSDTDEMILKIENILSLSNEEAHNIRNNARNRCVQSKYSYLERTKFAISEIKKII